MSFGLDGQASASASATTSVSASLTTTAHPDYVGVFVAWDGGSTSVGISDGSGNTWTQRQRTVTITKIGGVALAEAINIAYFYTTTSANLTGDSITASFSADFANAVISAFGVKGVVLRNTANIDSNIRPPFDTNSALGSASVLAVAGATSYSVPFSTGLDNDFVVAFSIQYPYPAGEAVGSGWTQLNKGDATDFGWIAEYQIFTLPQTQTGATFTTTAGTYTALTIVDGIVAIAATNNPYTQIYKGDLINSNGIDSQFFYPAIITTVGNTTTIDASNSASTKTSETHTSLLNAQNKAVNTVTGLDNIQTNENNS